ncbi:helix-turn-helix transcriptional regulator [Gloeobacter kilaueensis]|uniref:Transcriptional regulator n=1 Tax=Gloeobacter kilaueensis (strain ATCC BAA-2537 / CCAP 1431/1 / ULC 316 / JS1) TaxID=1183438 RepID=U5QII5_GLOK1|nr:transcriptional regulator [Gloeobacter kilaueensis]AGY58698.1 transcriptional regulator [Gloeobacter kilaueensis JS1]
MKKNPSPRHFERLLKLDGLIREGRPYTAAQLAEKLDVSVRTVQSDLDFLRDRYEAPLENSRTQGFFYRDPKWRLPLVPLSQGELFALVLGSRMLEAAAGAAYSQELQSAIDQLTKRMSDQTWADLQTIVDERFQFGAGGLLDLNPEFWKLLVEASSKQQQVEMMYYTASTNQLTTRKFDPYLMYVYRGTNPYTIGFCHNRQGIRVFRVDRIRQLRLCPEHFERETDFQPQRYLDTVFQIEAGGQPQPIAIHFSAKVAPFIRERRWHHTQQIEAHSDGSLTLRMSVPGLSEVKRWVLGYGEDAVVEGPLELVEMIRTAVARMAASYPPSP